MKAISPAYYNEFEPFAAQWLRNLIAKNLIPPGDVDERSIVEVQPSDLTGYAQCHFFAGIGGWALAARLAGWPDDRELWTGSCPCQPFSAAGKQKGQADERHLWPEYRRLIRACWPAAVVGEQVANAIGKHWLDGVLADLEDSGYAARAVVLPACAVDAPHKRERVWFAADGYGLVGNGECEGLQGHAWNGCDAREGSVEGRSTAAASAHGPAPASVGNAKLLRCDSRITGDAGSKEATWRAHGLVADRSHSAFWPGGCVECVDGKFRRIGPGVRLLAHGVPARVGRLRAYGNAIVPQEAAEVIGAFMDCVP